MLMESGRFDRHLRRMRASYAGRRVVLVEALAKHAPDVALTGMAAGFHAVAHLPGQLAEGQVITAARERSTGLYRPSEQPSEPSPNPAPLALGFRELNAPCLSAGIAAGCD